MKSRRKYIYGHTKTLRQIRAEYPFEDVEVDKKLLLSERYTVTFDAYLAYELIKKGYEAVAWGAIYGQRHVFVINKKPMPLSELPLCSLGKYLKE